VTKVTVRYVVFWWPYFNFLALELVVRRTEFDWSYCSSHSDGLNFSVHFGNSWKYIKDVARVTVDYVLVVSVLLFVFWSCCKTYRIWLRSLNITFWWSQF